MATTQLLHLIVKIPGTCRTDDYLGILVEHRVPNEELLGRDRSEMLATPIVKQALLDFGHLKL